MNSFDDDNDNDGDMFGSDLTDFNPNLDKEEIENTLKEIHDKAYTGEDKTLDSKAKVRKEYDRPVSFRIKGDLDKKIDAMVLNTKKSRTDVFNYVVGKGIEFLESNDKKDDLIINEYQQKLLLAWSQLPKNLGKSPSELLNSMIEQCLKNKVSL